MKVLLHFLVALDGELYFVKPFWEKAKQLLEGKGAKQSVVYLWINKVVP